MKLSDTVVLQDDMLYLDRFCYFHATSLMEIRPVDVKCASAYDVFQVILQRGLRLDAYP